MKSRLHFLAKKTFSTVLKAHKENHFLYTLDQTLLTDQKLLVEATIATTAEIKTLRKCFGEAQIEMLYQSSDAAVRGIELPEGPKHDIFLKYLENNLGKEGLIKKAGRLSRHS